MMARQKFIINIKKKKKNRYCRNVCGYLEQTKLFNREINTKDKRH